MKPYITEGKTHVDSRGILAFNNNFDASAVKRIYVIENKIGFIRGWQGHKIEKRWFCAVAGSFQISLIKIDNWDMPNKNLEADVFVVSSKKLDFLHVPSGFVSCIKSLEENAKLLVLSDYLLGEIDDEYRYPLEYFNKQ